MSQRITEGHK